MYDNLHEILTSFGADIDFEDPKLGQSGWYKADLVVPDEGRVGTVDGGYRLVMHRGSDGMPMVHLSETLSFPQGDVHVQAWAEFPNLSNGNWLYCPAVGISGELTGRQGFRQWRPVELGKLAEAKVIFYTSPTQ
ncbi:allene oxide cyclase barrel-like domain-containing protein [Micromonospora antibiotica]|uniref:Allene oxide cyclase barrel-like domain-containing protein n=1 Tax=Micromonospora antibiotica TaxID=2807623 RepID=A0ABS3V8F1_9ACTN|nr:hypothetical protein [Micromonospora antibiotica]MBO4161866.1 hypothetical protein [Micromonospora antibiotica]